MEVAKLSTSLNLDLKIEITFLVGHSVEATENILALWLEFSEYEGRRETDNRNVVGN